MIKKLTSERFPSMVGMEYENEASANAAILSVKRTPGLETASTKLIEPEDPDLARKLEPESQGIARTMVKTHLILGTAGLVLGLMLAFALLAAEVQMIAANVTIAVPVLAAFGLVFGLMAGGLVGLRPDHDPIIQKARESSSAGKWFVVVHAINNNQRDQARNVLEGSGNPGESVLQTI